MWEHLEEAEERAAQIFGPRIHFYSQLLYFLLFVLWVRAWEMFSSICNPHVHGAHPGERFPWDGEDPCLCCTKSHRCTLRASVLGGGFSSSRGGDGQQPFLSGQNLGLEMYLGLEVKQQL